MPTPQLSNQLEQIFFNKKFLIEKFFKEEFKKYPPPFYCSVDLRNAGFKISGIDTNLFPAGFNNLAKSSRQLVANEFAKQIEGICPESKKILIIAESNTRNLSYLQNLHTLKNICELANFEVRLASFLAESMDLTTKNGEPIRLSSLERKNDYLMSEDDFTPCAILLNNDLSTGLPEIMQGIKQPIIPNEQMGWQYRLKSIHFEHYQNICSLFAEKIGIDSWLINPLFRKCGKINFMKKSGEDCLAENVAILLGLIHDKYKQYNIKEKPFVVIKDDAGTYGMGIITVSNADEVYSLNRKQRKKMNYGKSKNSINKVILQEGIISIESVEIDNKSAVAEAVIYLSNGKVVGCFWRAHKDKDSQSVLNTPGMEFFPIDISSSIKTNTNNTKKISESLFYSHSVAARIATLAASCEIHQLSSK